MEQYERITRAALDIVEANASYVHDLPVGGLSRCAFLASCLFTTAAAMRAAVTIADERIRFAFPL
jgi:hypothetical protein